MPKRRDPRTGRWLPAVPVQASQQTEETARQDREQWLQETTARLHLPAIELGAVSATKELDAAKARHFMETLDETLVRLLRRHLGKRWYRRIWPWVGQEWGSRR